MPRPKKERADDERTWVIRDVDDETRRTVKVYAAAHDLTLAQALAQLIEKGMQYDELNETSPILIEKIRQSRERRERRQEHVRPEAALLKPDLDK